MCSNNYRDSEMRRYFLWAVSLTAEVGVEPPPLIALELNRELIDQSVKKRNPTVVFHDGFEHPPSVVEKK
jgi:hypothetical protein